MPLTQVDKKYLSNKHKGGINNSKGNTYENFYAVYCIAILIDKYIKALDDVHISSQLELCFVDDLLIQNPQNHLIYHQIKDVKKLSWDTKNLLYDFERQKELSTELKQDFELKLVHSSNNKKLNNIPPEIKDCTTNSLFPNKKEINKLILDYLPFRDAISGITLNRTLDNAELLNIAQAILGVWDSIDQNHVSLKFISDSLLKQGKGLINIKTYPNAYLSDKCKEIFNKNKLIAYTQGIKLYWSSQNGRMRGEIEWTKEKSKEIEETNPSDTWSLLELLN